jgi:uncharacterized protein YjiS (DUF1127 family)
MSSYTPTSPQNLVDQSFGLISSVHKALHAWFELQLLKSSLRQERRQLAGLAASQLKDIGIDRQQACAEAASTGLPAQRLALLPRN